MQKQRKQLCRRLGEALRETRKERGLSQEGLALAAEVNRTYMGSLERGEENVSFCTLLKITDVLRVKPSELLDRAGF